MLIDMARIFRRAANKVKNSRDGHGSLGLLIFNEKVVFESFQKIVMAQAQGEKSEKAFVVFDFTLVRGRKKPCGRIRFLSKC